MATKILLAALAVIAGLGLAEGCFARPDDDGGITLFRNQQETHASGSETQPNARFLSHTISQLLYLGSSDGRAYYAALENPMDWDTASDYCHFSNMNLTSPTPTEIQSQFLATSVNDIAYVFGIDNSESEIRYWTSARTELELNSEQCGTVSLSAENALTPGYAACSDTVDITICETED